MENDVTQYKLVTTWRGGMTSRTRCQSCTVGERVQSSQKHIIDSDEPEALGGTGLAPGPRELMLAAFNACMTAAFISEADRLNVTVTHLEIQTAGKLHTGLPVSSVQDVDDWIHYTLHVKGGGGIREFENIHSGVISSSPTRWLLAQNMTIEGDLIVN
jgi:uncharacterized OsmC-like protein